MEPFINKYIWKETNYSSEKSDWEKGERNNPTVALYILHTEKEKIYPPYVSKHNSKLEKQVTLLMIPNGKVWNYVAV